MMKSFYLISNATKDKEYTVTRSVAGYLHDKGVTLYMDEGQTDTLALSFVVGASLDSVCGDLDALLVLGGDGSMIDASALALKYDLPMLGVNLGRLGYLTGIEPSELETLDEFLCDTPMHRQHIVLSVHMRASDGSLIEREAVNDVVLTREPQGKLADVSLSDGRDGSPPIRYHGDGVIVCTPLGSTAYSLSAGGPIIDSDAETVCVTPLCPHSFFSRSILFSAKNRLSLRNDSPYGEGITVQIDGRASFTLAAGEALEITVSEKKLTILSTESHGVLGTLHKKMLLAGAKS